MGFFASLWVWVVVIVVVYCIVSIWSAIVAGRLESQYCSTRPRNTAEVQAVERTAKTLALAALGHYKVEAIERSGLSISSKINPDLCYQLSTTGIYLWKRGKPIGNFCLRTKTWYPLWDVVLSQVFMLRYQKNAFLSTANYLDYSNKGHPQYQPLSLAERQRIYERMFATQWLISTSSTPQQGTPR